MKPFRVWMADGEWRSGIASWEVFLSPILSLPFLLLALFLFSACDDSFDPLTENQSEFFGLYGFLDSDADTQFVRVSPVRPLLNTGSRSTDTQVFSTQIGRNERVAWRDSAVVLDDGTTGLLFYAPFRPERGTRYLLEARDADDQTTEAITEVPADLSLQVDSLTQPFEYFQHITWLGLTRQPNRPMLRYRVAPATSSTPVVVTLPVTLSGRSTVDGWMFSINLSQDRKEILRQLGLSTADSSLVLFDVEMEIEQLSEEWRTPDIPFNIQNGFGFFGAISTSRDTWTIEPSALQKIGFAAPPEGLH